jgi:hypothetical protein
VAAIINTPRPFIRTAEYFGPDRRRRKNDSYKGKERRDSLFGPKPPTKPDANRPSAAATL